MLSGLVYFEEIVENVKDATGLENLRPHYDRLRRSIFNAERQIGAGGLIIRKKKQMTKGDGFYDGRTIVMPADFIQEYSYGDLSAGSLNGNILSLACDGPDEIDLYYMGFLLDNYGNPVTTRNHMDAVVAYCVYRLYSPRVFLGKGSANIYQMYFEEYKDECHGARGLDAFPTEEEWSQIGLTMNGGAFEAFTNCGLNTILSDCNDTFFSNEGEVAPGDDERVYCNCDFVKVFESSLIDLPPEDFNLSFSGSFAGETTLTGNLTNL